MSSTYTCKHGSTEMLTPRNYHTWKADIMVFLTCENALEIVLGNEDPPLANASFAMRESYKKRLGLATGMVYSSVEPSIRAIINKLPDRNPAQIWTALGEKFNTATSRSGRMAIRKRFQFTTMKDGTSVQAYIGRLTTIQQELSGTPDEHADGSRQVDANATRHRDADGSRQVDADTETSRQADADSPRPTDPSSLAADELCLNTRRYNLRKRPRAVAHRTWVEEEPDSADPVSYQNAVRHPRLGPKWSEAIREELHSLHSNYTWDYIRPEDVPSGVKPISSKWVFKTKQLSGGGIRYKARLVIRGYEQIPGVDFDETFAPVAKLSSLRMLLALAAIHDWEIDQMDVVTAFLNPEVDGDVYMAMPDGVEAPAGGPWVCKLRKSLYGLKQAPRLWYEHIDNFLRSLGLLRSEYDPNVYISATGLIPLILLLYVDDILLFSESVERVSELKKLLHAKYQMTDLGPIRQFLGLEIERDRENRILYVHQSRYIHNILATFGLSECNGHWTPQPTSNRLRRLDDTGKPLDENGKQKYQSIIGSLNWLMQGTRPDIAFTVSMLSKFLSAPSSEHLAAATYTLRYLRNTSDLAIQYSTERRPDSQPTERPIGFTDSDFAGDQDDRKSTSGYVFTLGNGAISWRAHKQPLVAFSTVEAEYIGASDAAKEAIWISSLFTRLLSLDAYPQEIFVDNQGAIQLAKNPKFHERTKHIGVRYHFVRDACERNAIRTTYLPTSEMTADIMTKSLPRETHWKHVNGMGMVRWAAGEAYGKRMALGPIN